MPSFARFEVSLALLLLGASSCEHRRVSVPAAPAPVPSQPASRTTVHSNPPPQPAAPQTSNSETSAPEPSIAVPSSSATGSEAPPANRYQVNKAAQSAKKAARSKKPAPSLPVPSPPSPAGVGPDSPAPAPKLGDVLTADERNKYDASIDESLAHARTSLDEIKQHRLTADQGNEVEQITNFMKQAQASRASDLAGAKSLAERAEVLAKDLAAALH
jgi:hypothetical protein